MVRFANARAQRIFEKGRVVFLAPFRGVDGGRWLAFYRGRYYLLVHDGTGNEFFASHEPRSICENDAKRLALEYDKRAKAEEVFGWSFSDEEIDQLLGL